MPSDTAADPAVPSAAVGPLRFRLDPALRTEQAERRRLERDLAEAVRRGAFTLCYQPRVTLAGGAASGAEALIRWPHPRRGVVPPSLFIPLAEGSGQILPIGAWVLCHACREAAGWRAGGVVSVNVSARQLAGGALLGQLAAALEESALPPERLEIELTEQQLVQVDTETLLLLSAVRDLGVGIVLDEFGTGYAALAVLKRLPLTALKLDRSLVRGLPGEREDAAIARAVISTGRALGLTVVAEGIETEAQRAFLAASGCDEGQGCLFSRPLPAEMLRAWLAPAQP